MKRIFVLTLTLLLCLGCSAWAENSVTIEVIKMDGVSVVVLYVKESDENQTDFFLPQSLTQIDESAFEGIAAECIEVSENVSSIDARAFANCQNLRQIYIPAGVEEIHKDALKGCKNVTVYGSTDVVKTFAEANGFTFIDPNAEITNPPVVIEKSPVMLPFVQADG